MVVKLAPLPARREPGGALEAHSDGSGASCLGNRSEQGSDPALVAKEATNGSLDSRSRRSITMAPVCTP